MMKIMNLNKIKAGHKVGVPTYLSSIKTLKLSRKNNAYLSFNLIMHPGMLLKIFEGRKILGVQKVVFDCTTQKKKIRTFKILL